MKAHWACGQERAVSRGVGFMGMGVEEFKDGYDEQALGLTAQYESVDGKPGKETWTLDHPQKVMKSKRQNMSLWCCG